MPVKGKPTLSRGGPFKKTTPPGYEARIAPVSWIDSATQMGTQPAEAQHEASHLNMFATSSSGQSV